MAGGLNFSFALTGLKMLTSKLDSTLINEPVRKLLMKGVLLLDREVKQNTPIDTGRLRASWTTLVDSKPFPEFAQLGTRIQYAAELEYSHRKPRGVGRIPFLTPAVQTLQGKLDELLAEAKRLIETRWGEK